MATIQQIEAAARAAEGAAMDAAREIRDGAAPAVMTGVRVAEHVAGSIATTAAHEALAAIRAVGGLSVTGLLPKSRMVLLAGLALSFAGLGVTALWYRGEALKGAATIVGLRSDLQTAKSANAMQAAAIAKLNAMRASDDATLGALAKELQRINAAQTATQGKIDELARQNAHVSDYLKQPIPDDLRRLLNRPKRSAGP